MTCGRDVKRTYGHNALVLSSSETSHFHAAIPTVRINRRTADWRSTPANPFDVKLRSMGRMPIDAASGEDISLGLAWRGPRSLRNQANDSAMPRGIYASFMRGKCVRALQFS